MKLLWGLGYSRQTDQCSDAVLSHTHQRSYRRVRTKLWVRERLHTQCLDISIGNSWQKLNFNQKYGWHSSSWSSHKKGSNPTVCRVCMSFSVWVGFLPQSKDIQVRCIGNSKLGVNGCVCLPVSPVIDGWPVQAVQHLSPYACSDRLQPPTALHRTSQHRKLMVYNVVITFVNLCYLNWIEEKQKECRLSALKNKWT